MPTTPVEQHQKQAIAEKQGIIGEKVTSMAGLKIKNLFRMSFFSFYMRNFNKNRPYACGAYTCGAVRPLAYEFFTNFSKLGGI